MKGTLTSTPKGFVRIATWCRQNGVPVLMGFDTGFNADYRAAVGWFSSRVMKDHYPDEFEDGGCMAIHVKVRDSEAGVLLRLRFPEFHFNAG